MSSYYIVAHLRRADNHIVVLMIITFIQLRFFRADPDDVGNITFLGFRQSYGNSEWTLKRLHPMLLQAGMDFLNPKMILLRRQYP